MSSSDYGKCRWCSADQLGFDITMAFQPILDTQNQTVFAHEALVRGLDGSGAGTVLDRVNSANRYAFDQLCRARAVELAARLDPTATISINFLPNAVYDPATCLRATIAAADANAFPLEQIVFEITEGEKVEDHGRLLGIVDEYKRRGFRVAIDDFGAGYAGLELLAEMAPDLVKLDMKLVRDIDTNRRRHAIARGNLMTCHELGIRVIAEGVETYAEYKTLRELGVELFQGFLFARPALEQLHDTSDICWPRASENDGQA